MFYHGKMKKVSSQRPENFSGMDKNKHQIGQYARTSWCWDASNSRANNSRNTWYCIGASNNIGYRAIAWVPVTVGPTTEETPATAKVPATAWTRTRAWTPLTALTMDIRNCKVTISSKDDSNSRETINRDCWMRFSRVVRASDSQCRSRNCPHRKKKVREFPVPSRHYQTLPGCE